MSIFSAMTGWFKGDPYSVSDEEATCACGGQCACGESSSINEDTTADITITNITTTIPTSSTFSDVTNNTPTNTTSNASGDIKTILVSEVAPIEESKLVAKNEAIVETQVEESSKSEEPVQLELDLSDTVEEKASTSVVTDSILSSAEASTRNRTRKSKSKKGKKKKK